uniref:Putative capsid protein n=1 Tax=viral metagenome TaxID=1070528 RepID=A0A6H1ZIV0_9ZZZZ
MLTKVQSDYLKSDLVLEGVWDTIVKESPITQALPFKAINNDIIKYNVELTMPTVSWLQPRDQITENTGTFEQRTTNIYTLIGDADTDKSMIAMNPLQNPESVDIEAKAKAMAHAFDRALIFGQTTTLSSTKEFKGLMRMLAEFESATTTDLDGVNNSQVIVGHATSAALTMAMLDELLDQIKPGKPDLLLMSRRMNRWVTALQRASGSGLQMVDAKLFGLQMPSYDTIPILESDWIPDNLPNGSSSVLTISTYDQSTARAADHDNSIIFAMKISEEDVTALQAGNMTHERETFIEDSNAIRNRFSWNVSMMCKKKFSLAALINVLDVALS